MPVADVYVWGNTKRAPSATAGVTVIEPFKASRGTIVNGVYGGGESCVVAALDRLSWVSSPSSDPFDLTHVTSANFGVGFTVILRKGSVFSCGEGKQGQLGLGPKDLSQSIPKQITALSNVIKVSCGNAHTAALTAAGDVFTWGRGFEGQLGYASEHLTQEINEARNKVQLVPKVVPTFVATKTRSRPVLDVACGHNFTIVVTKAGEVWAFGEGGVGQLGCGRISKVMIPRLVIEGPGLVQAVCGWAHVLARTEVGDVLCWGFNQFGQLGLGDLKPRFTPECIEGLYATDIVASGHDSGALTHQDEVMVWGSQAGATVQAIASLTVVPSCITSMSPLSAPSGGGTEVVLRGCGLWASEDIVVGFRMGKIAKAVVATFCKDELGQYVRCETPVFGSAATVSVELALNGRDFIPCQQEFTIYDEPTATSLTPKLCKPTHSGKLRIGAKGLTHADTLVVKFAETEEEGEQERREYLVKATLEEESCSVGIDDETEEEIFETKQTLLCELPAVEGPLPFTGQLCIAPNGVSFTVTHLTLTVHDPRPDTLSPTHVMSRGGDRLFISGTGLYQYKGMAVQLVLQADGSRQLATDVCFLADTGSVSFKLPSYEEVIPEEEASVEVQVLLLLAGKEYFPVKENLVVYREVTMSFASPPAEADVEACNDDSGEAEAETVPSIPAPRPGCIPVEAGAELMLKCAGPLVQGAASLTLRLSTETSSQQVPLRYVPQAEDSLACTLPPLKPVPAQGSGFTSASVSVTMNGVHFTKCQEQLRYFAPPIITELSPASIKDYATPVIISGQGIVDTGAMAVRLESTGEEECDAMIGTDCIVLVQEEEVAKEGSEGETTTITTTSLQFKVLGPMPDGFQSPAKVLVSLDGQTFVTGEGEEGLQLAINVKKK